MAFGFALKSNIPPWVTPRREIYQEKIMKKIINGVRYDTDMSTEIGSWNNGLSSQDFNVLEETLYKTKKGNYFLYGEGGARTHYAQSDGNMTTDGSAFIPMTKEAAFSWAQRHLSAPKVEAEFGDLIEEA
jgi:hypothetical protein